MTPTAKLRFLEKTIHFNSLSTTSNGIPIIGTQKFRVLQQWWEEPNILETTRQTDERGQPYVGYKYKGEWRDVPLETEE